MQRYCVIGYPVGHSLSPKIHNRWFRKFRIPARYEACEVKPADLAKFMRNFHAKFAGANVTIPHKEKIIKFLDVLSPEARAIGAVNCIVNQRGKLVGYNTDVYGAMEVLRGEVKSQRSKGKSARPAGAGTPKLKVKFLKGKKVAVLGAGGAARAVAYGLKKAGAKVTILNRTLSRAKKLAKDFKCSYMPLRVMREAHSDLVFDILINTTSVGMWRKKVKRQTTRLRGYPEGKSARPAGAGTPKLKVKKMEIPLPQLSAILKDFPKKPLVMDIIYTPRLTKFLRDAKKAGCKIIMGDKMFFAQAAKSFELWIGQRVTSTKP